MNSPSYIEVHLSRWIAFGFLGMGLIFLLFGWWVVFGGITSGSQTIGTVTTTTTVSPYAHLLGWVPLGLGIAVSLRQLQYLIAPPLMLRVDQQAVTFGVGFGYKPYRISLSYLESIVDLKAALSLKFKEAPEVPAALITSIGLRYILYLLTLNRLYMNRPPKDVVEFTQALLKEHFPDDLAAVH